MFDFITFLFVSSDNSSNDIDTSVSTSYLSEIGHISLFGSGFLIVLATLFLYLYLEIRYLYRRFFYKTCLNEVIDAPQSLDSAYEGKLVFLVGKLLVDHPYYLTDPVLPLFETAGSLLLQRHVEMLQWTKNKKNIFEAK